MNTMPDHTADQPAPPQPRPDPRNELIIPNAQTMPFYACHKIVQALQIATVAQDPMDSALTKHTRLTFVDGRFAPIIVLPEVTARYTPNPGDYYVVYQDGYQSFSPQVAFEDGYVLAGGTAQTDESIARRGGPGPMLGPAE